MRTTRGTICQYGSGYGDYPVYRGISRQYGNGLGSIFKTVLRTVAPILKPMAKAGIQSAKKVAKEHGVKALKEIIKGKNVKQVLKHRGKSVLQSFGKSTINQMSSGIKRKRKPKKNQSKSRPRAVHNKKYPKFPKDIFDQK